MVKKTTSKTTSNVTAPANKKQATKKPIVRQEPTVESFREEEPMPTEVTTPTEVVSDDSVPDYLPPEDQAAAPAQFVVEPMPAPPIEAEQAPEPEVTITTKEDSEFSDELNSLIDEANSLNDDIVSTTIASFLEYTQAMKPGRQMSVQNGAREQVKLLRAMQHLVNSRTENFPILFATVLRIVDELKNGVFNDRYAFRFVEDMNANTNDREGFVRFMNLIRTVSSVAGREISLKQVDLNKSLEFGFSQEGKQKVISFFTN